MILLPDLDQLISLNGALLKRLVYTDNSFVCSVRVYCQYLFLSSFISHTLYNYLPQAICMHYALLCNALVLCVCVVGQQGISMTIIVCVNMINR